MAGASIEEEAARRYAAREERSYETSRRPKAGALQRRDGPVGA
jgi:hypothetical protein